MSYQYINRRPPSLMEFPLLIALGKHMLDELFQFRSRQVVTLPAELTCDCRLLLP